MSVRNEVHGGSMSAAPYVFDEMSVKVEAPHKEPEISGPLLEKSHVRSIVDEGQAHRFKTEDGSLAVATKSTVRENEESHEDLVLDEMYEKESNSVLEDAMAEENGVVKFLLASNGPSRDRAVDNDVVAGVEAVGEEPVASEKTDAADSLLFKSLMEPDLRTQAMIARHYIFEGHNEEAEAIMKEMEGEDNKNNRFACKLLLPLYASFGKDTDVERIWKTGENKPRPEECVIAIDSQGDKVFGSTDKIPTDAIPLQLVSTLRITREFSILVFDPGAKVNLSVTGRNRCLDVVTKDTLAADLSQPPEIKEFSYLVLRTKGLGVATVTVQDIRLSPPAVASAVVKVANVDWIKNISKEEISLMEGAIHAFDTQDGYIFDSSQYEFLHTHVHLDDGILELVSMNSSPRFGGWIISKPHFTVRAAALGTTTLYVCVTQGNGHEIINLVAISQPGEEPKTSTTSDLLGGGSGWELAFVTSPSNKTSHVWDPRTVWTVTTHTITVVVGSGVLALPSLMVWDPGIMQAAPGGTLSKSVTEINSEASHVAFISNCLVQEKVLYPFPKQVGGSILAAKFAKERGWANNVGWGFHHCSTENGGGFCAYADFSLCIQYAFVRLSILSLMIIDLVVHQRKGSSGSSGQMERDVSSATWVPYKEFLRDYPYFDLETRSN